MLGTSLLGRGGTDGSQFNLECRTYGVDSRQLGENGSSRERTLGWNGKLEGGCWYWKGMTVFLFEESGVE